MGIDQQTGKPAIFYQRGLPMVEDEDWCGQHKPYIEIGLN
jgi:hypothetical protein